MLKINNLSASINKKVILNDINLEIKSGEIHALLGPNGSGKSSLATVLTGNEEWEINEGSFILDNEDVIENNIEERALKGLYLAVQKPVQFPGVPVFNFLKEIDKSKNEYMKKNNMDIFDFADHINDLCEKVGLPIEYLKRDFNVGFSGGESKRLELLQILLLEPKWVILDEIDSGMDIEAINKTIEIIKDLSGINKTAFLIISHQPKLLKSLPIKKVHIMIKGKIVYSGNKSLINKVYSQGYSEWEV